MSRYVDIEPIIASHTNTEYKVSDISFAEVLYAPSIDIVHCKECKYGEVCSNYYDDGFCSTGERGELKTIYNDGVVVAKMVCE